MVMQHILTQFLAKPPSSHNISIYFQKRTIHTYLQTKNKTVKKRLLKYVIPIDVVD